MTGGTSTWRRRIAGALFQSSLIVLGVVAAFAVNERHDTRVQAKRIDALVTAIRNEIEANLAVQVKAVVYNTEVAEGIWGLAKAGAEFVPGDIYPQGLLQRPSLTSAAWDASRDGALDTLPVDVLLAIAAAYAEQRDYLQSTDILLSTVYAQLLQREGAVLYVDGVSSPLGAGAMLGSYAARATRVTQRYEAALKHLDGMAR